MPFLGKASHMRTSCFKRWCFQTYIQVLEIMVSSGEDLDEFYDLTCVHILFRKAWVMASASSHALQDSPLHPRHGGIFRWSSKPDPCAELWKWLSYIQLRMPTCHWGELPQLHRRSTTADMLLVNPGISFLCFAGFVHVVQTKHKNNCCAFFQKPITAPMIRAKPKESMSLILNPIVYPLILPWS